jgi:HAE1 family hydrophobic/amphiphilic exporter-1
MPRLAAVRDADSPFLYNPKLSKITISLRLRDMLLLDLRGAEVRSAITNALKSYNGGQIPFGQNEIRIYFPPTVRKLEDFQNLPIVNSKGQEIRLSQVADIVVGPSEDSGRVFKTSGFTSLILWASPKPQGNIKEMSEDILSEVRAVAKELPADIQYKILVDPSEFIRSAISHVGWEVIIASSLAVLVLFLFMGNVRNVATAAIEIPLSILLAFILMYLFDVPINLISLGGFALAAGMNVDASIVVMENIFRLFEERGHPKDFAPRLKLIAEAVREVSIPVISSTLISLVVFAPLMMTSALTSALLGDLARAVIYSHGLCILISLFLVPVIRLFTLGSAGMESRAPLDRAIESFLVRYRGILLHLLRSKSQQLLLYGVFFFALAVACAVLLPRLPREIMAQPESDWVLMRITQSGNQNSRQMLSTADQVDSQLRADYAKEVDYTYLQVNSSSDATIMARLKSKRVTERVWKDLEKKFTDTPFTKFRVFPWNPSELEFPDPPQLELMVRGGDPEGKRQIAQELAHTLEEKKIFDRVWSEPSYRRNQTLSLTPLRSLYPKLATRNSQLEAAQLSQSLYLFDNVDSVGEFQQGGTHYPIQMQWQSDLQKDVHAISALPFKIGNAVYPLRAFFETKIEEAPAKLQTENLRSRYLIVARLNQERMGEKASQKKKALEAIEEWKANNKERSFGTEAFANYQIEVLDSERDLTNTLKELGIAMLLSLVLVALILYWQFNSWAATFTVFLAIPFALLGAVLSLFIFGSTLSINAALGVILLNGIAVANSILLVDFMDLAMKQGKDPIQAALDAATLRFRPILMTSLTTILGMLPVALGLGEGGKVLQPLGVAVSGGLWISMCLTLLLVPLTYAHVLERRIARAR